LNPGNITDKSEISNIVEAARQRSIPIRIGVNGGSLPKDLIDSEGLSARAMVQGALRHIKMLEELDFHDIKVSVKTSSVPLTIESYRLMSKTRDYPLHLGITEAGTELKGSVKSAIGIGVLLAEGIGDTIRVSLTSDPVREVIVAKEILKDLEIRKGLQIVSCPTCGRTEIDLIALTKKVEEKLSGLEDADLTVAVMGCVVNGPGEAKEADFAICGGKAEGLIFQAGNLVKKVPENSLVNELQRIISQYLDET
jgi:(E)-4-hydroxy-3-methylbut-2-enyl-diphosphate synthase